MENNAKKVAELKNKQDPKDNVQQAEEEEHIVFGVKVGDEALGEYEEKTPNIW